MLMAGAGYLPGFSVLVPLGMARQPGDLVLIGTPIGDVECIVMEVHPEDGRTTKARAAEPNEKLGKVGFFLEGYDYVIFELQIDYN
jgi:hypothetical protein